ncbi:MAG: glycoside hydrolase family 44 protein [Fimbriimonadaceae bacterium]|nr:glycoside hydrolase family 44 protein [Fimbriimonadaceae bacterium]
MLLALFPLLVQTPVRVEIDATRSTPISPYIYGVNFPDWGKMGRLFTVARQGGNRMTAYNWETNASNAGSDFHHQNDGYMGESNEPGWTVRTFMDAAQKKGAVPLLTIQMAGYVSADKNGDGDVNKTPDYLSKRFHPIKTNKGAAAAFPPDSKDGVVFADEFVTWVEKTRAESPPVWYLFDNEPDLWHSTHARIHPEPVTLREIIDKSKEFCTMIKRVAPGALTLAPGNYGFMGFTTLQGAKDLGQRHFIDAYLLAMRDAEKQSGKRLLDVLDVHWYPEAKGGGVRVAWGEDKPGTAEARIQAPRSLWDPTYVEDSWIADYLGKKPIVLLPDLQRRINKSYPNTKLAITEYDFGGGNHVSGMLAQADVLGIFGREGVFTACMFGLEPEDKAQLAGFRAFRDYDGKGSTFADRALRVSGVDPATASVYAALDRKNTRRMTVVVINKVARPQVFELEFKGFSAQSGRAWVMDSSQGFTAQPKEVSGGRVATPPLSVTTIELGHEAE